MPPIILKKKKTPREIIPKERKAHRDLGSLFFKKNLLRGFAVRYRIPPTMKGAKTLITYGKARKIRDKGIRKMIRSRHIDRRVRKETSFIYTPLK